MSNILKNNIFYTEDDYTTKNQEAKKALDNLINKLPSLTAEQWSEIFKLINSNSLGGKINIKEAYIVAFSKMLLRYALEINCMFAQYKKEFYIFNSKYWIEIELALLINFFKAAAIRVGIPEYIASNVTFINKLHKQFTQDATGIPSDIIEKIFDAYFTTKEENEGTGIGLHMCRQIINGMNGEITVSNVEYKYENENYKGAEFKIELPLS